MRLRLLVALLLLVAVFALRSSWPAPEPAVRHAEFRHEASVARGPFAPGDRLSVLWAPKGPTMTAAEVSSVVMCVALFGPWSTVEALKTAMADRPVRDCAADGAAAVSDVAKTTSVDGRSFTTELAVPDRAGLYDVRTISTVSAGGAWSTVVGGSIVEVRSP